MNSSSSFGPITRLRSGSGPLTSCSLASVALMETPVVIPCSARRPTTMNPPRGRGNHRSTPTTSCRRPGHAGQWPPAPGGVGWDALPGLYRSNYPAPHAEACCDPDRGRVRPVPLVRGGRPHRALHATDPDVEIIAYRHGYHGLLTGDSVAVDAGGAGRRRVAARATAAARSATAGSSSPTPRTCVEARPDRGGPGPAAGGRRAAAGRDGVDVLHTIGGDDTNTTAADLAAFLAQPRLRR